MRIRGVNNKTAPGVVHAGSLPRLARTLEQNKAIVNVIANTCAFPHSVKSKCLLWNPGGPTKVDFLKMSEQKKHSKRFRLIFFPALSCTKQLNHTSKPNEKQNKNCFHIYIHLCPTRKPSLQIEGWLCVLEADVVCGGQAIACDLHRWIMG